MGFELIDKKIRCGSSFSAVLDSFSQESRTKLVSFVNPFSYVELQKSPQALEDVDALFSDGSMLCVFHKLFLGERIERASFDYSSKAGEVFDFSVQEGLSLALIGGVSNEAEEAVKVFKDKHNGLSVKYIRHGYFSNNEEMIKVAKQIALLRVSIVILGMGTPNQEMFASVIKEVYPRGCLIFTCGGFLTQTSIRSDYYYPWVKKMGLRWLQRVIMHKHVRKRVLKEYPKFCYNYTKDHMSQRFK